MADTSLYNAQILRQGVFCVKNPLLRPSLFIKKYLHTLPFNLKGAQILLTIHFYNYVLKGYAMAFKGPLFALSVSLFSGITHADVVQVYYNDFSDTSNIQLNGFAADHSPNSDGELRLTGGDLQEAGSAFFLSPFTLPDDASFSSFFSFSIDATPGGKDSDGLGGDGLVFTLQTVSNTAGTQGGGLGYMGLDNSIGIEFDTWGNDVFNDVSDNHAGINVNGSVVSVESIDEPTRFNDGDSWYAWVDYDGSTDTLEVRYSLYPSRPSEYSLSYNVDLVDIFNASPVYVGFTASSGGAAQIHNIEQFAFENEYKILVEQGNVADVSGRGGVCALVIGALMFFRRRLKA